MTKRCICEICTCGRHRCPHRPRAVIDRGDAPCLLSEYANTYIKKHVPMRESFKPHFQPVKGQGPISDRTTFRTDFTAHQMEKPFVHQPEPYVRPQGNLDAMTSYNKEYTDKKAEPAKAIRREGMRKVEAPFEGEPTYRHDYRKWNIPRRELSNMEPQWKPPSERFGNNTTFQQDFIKHKQPPRKSLRPEERAMMSDQPMDDRTGYRDSYIKHQIPDKVNHQKEAWAPPTVPMDSLSTQKHDFTGKKGPKIENFSPSKVPFMSNQPFEGSTTFRTDFKQWGMERPFVHQPDQYVRPQGDMDLRSTTHIDFPLKRGEPAMAKKQAPRRPNSAAFEGTTNYSQDFRKWTLGERPQQTMRPDYVPPNAPFEGISTFQSHYIPHKMAPTQSFKPDSSAFLSDTKFDDATMYRMEYLPKKTDYCPASMLDTGKSGYVYRDQDSVGHKFYQPVIETVTELPGKSNSDTMVNKMTAMAMA